MGTQIKDIKDKLIFQAGYIATNIGLNKAMGQIYGALYLSRKPVSLEELAKVCRMSKGNASINIRRLERWGAVKKSWAEDDRRDYYEANKDILGFTIKHGIRVFNERLQEGEEIISDTDKNVSGVDDAQLTGEEKETIEYYRKNLKELSALINKLKKIVSRLSIIEDFIK